MDIHILVIPNEEIKKRKGFTGADWWFEYPEEGKVVLQIRVAQMSSREREAALIVHEMVEAILCHFHGVTVEQVDAFDELAEADDHSVDAGDLPGCPYGKEHTTATIAERAVFNELQPNIGAWTPYDDELGNL
jgi:hypothetical protein